MSDVHLFAFPPVPALAPFVEVIWGVRGAIDWFQEVVLPNGVVELMINFGPTQRVTGYGEVAADDPFRRAWIAGIQDQPLGIASPDGSDHMGVRFRPGGAHAFFDLPMDALRNQVVELEQVLGRHADDLRDRLWEAGSDRARASLVEQWLLDRRYGVHPYYATCRRALDILSESAFRTGIGELCERLGLSNRHLIQQFREVVGLTPKTAARIARFHAVVRDVRDQDDVDWAATAYRFGFADQSHLIREFRRFGGVTPAEFLRRRTPDHYHLLQA